MFNSNLDKICFFISLEILFNCNHNASLLSFLTGWEMKTNKIRLH